MPSWFRTSLQTSSLLPIVLMLAGGAALRAHPFHITTAEAHLNRETNALQVGLELNPAELERSLELASNRDFSLEQDDAESLVAEYARKSFVVQDGDQPVDMQWVGMELDISSGWLYFEFNGIDSAESLTVTNRFLVEFAQIGDNEQINTVIFHDRGKRQTLTFSAPTYRLKLNEFE